MPKHVPLTSVPVGETVSIIEILGGRAIHNRLWALGIRPGVKVTKISGSFGRGPVVLQVGGAQTALGRGICGKIVVELAQ